MPAFPTEPTEWRGLLDAALEHGSHAWGALSQSGLLPAGTTTNCWPPNVPEGDKMSNVGSSAYHMAAMLNYIWKAWNGMCEIYPKERDDYDV